MARTLREDVRPIEIRLLGAVAALRGDKPLELTGSKPLATLSLLALRAGQRVTPDELVEGIWDGGAPEHARHAMHVFVSTLRRVLGPETIATYKGGGYELTIEPANVDALRFSTLVKESLGLPPEAAVATLRQALDLWRGPALAGVVPTPMLSACAADLEEQRLEALERCLAVELELGRDGPVVGELAALVAAEPLRERSRALLMLALYRCGRQADALACYRDGRRLLVEQLGIEPQRELRELEQAILRQDPALAAPEGDGSANGHRPRFDANVVATAVALGESWASSLRDRDEGAFAALDADAHLIDQAMETAIALDDREHALRLIGAVWFYWIVRGLQQRANTWCRQAVELSRNAAPLVEARGLVGASEIARACGDYRHSAMLKEEALRLNEELGDGPSVAALLADLAHLWVRLDDLCAAEAYAMRAVELRRNDNTNLGGVAHALLALGEVKEHQGNLAVATLHYQDAIEVARELGLEGEAAFVRARLLGRVARKKGDYHQAFGTYRRALLDSLPLRDAGTVAMATQGLGWVAAERGDKAGAVRCYASVSGEQWQCALDPEERQQFAADLDWLRQSVDPTLFEAAWNIGLESPPFEIGVSEMSSAV